MDSFVGNKLAARTLVQLDGDVLTFVTPFTYTMEPCHAIHAQHWKEVDRALGKISSQLKFIVHTVTWSGAFLTFAIMSVSTLRDLSFHDWDTNTWAINVLANVVLPVAIGTTGHLGYLRKLLAPLFLKVLRFWVRQHAGHDRIEALLTAKRVTD